MDYFIVKTRKTSKAESEITHYEQNTNKTASGTISSKASFRAMVNIGSDRFYSYNVQQGTLVECEWYQFGQNGEPFLKSDPNGSKKDNLLELPDC